MFILTVAFLAQSLFADTATSSTLMHDDLDDAPAPRMWETTQYQDCMKEKPSYEGPNTQGSGNEAAKVLFRKADPKQLPSVRPEGDLPSLRQALERQTSACKNSKDSESIKLGDRVLGAREFCTQVNEKMLELAREAADMPAFLEKVKNEFDWYQKINADGKESSLLYTGYNAPTFDGTLKNPGEECRWPLYSKPKDLVMVKEGKQTVTRRKNPESGVITMYFDRLAINSGALKGQNLELQRDGKVVCMNSPLDIALLQVEGSGFIKYPGPDGKPSKMHVGYDAVNGHPNVSLAKSMRCMGIEKKYLSGTGMREYFKQHPVHLEDFVNLNKSYVFFKADKSPMGSGGQSLTARHSLAVDKKLIPMGAVTLFSTRRPPPPERSKEGPIDFTSIGLAQDVGGAIKGNHIDIYWGDDDYSHHAANTMQGYGPVFVAVPKLPPQP